MVPVIVGIPALNLFLVFLLAGVGWAAGQEAVIYAIGRLTRRP